MKLHLEWNRLIQLRDATRQNLVYAVDLDLLPASAGIYIFGRGYGASYEALYVGKANKIRGRVKSQFNNLRLMQHLKHAKAGKRILLVGRFVAKPGQQATSCLQLIERALIRHFLLGGHDLVNIQGTRLRRHEITSAGKHPKKFIPRLMYPEKRR